MKENSYGIVKRYTYLADIINKEVNGSSLPVRILDLGCGTGEKLTIPLARTLVDRCDIVAYDIDDNSLQHLKKIIVEESLTNIQIINDYSELNSHKFKIIIMSEVLEHVSNPQDFLKDYLQLLDNDGKLIITIPNGYGYFELANLFVGLLDSTKILSLLSKGKAIISRKESLKQKATLATSPHINFFSFKEMEHLLGKTGLEIEKYDGRVFMCGYFISWLIDRSKALIRMNNYLGSSLPPSLVSGWMFVLKPSDPTRHHEKTEYRNGILRRGYLSLKRFVNAKRYGM